MLAKENRLFKDSDFKNVFKEGLYHRNSFFVLKYLKTDNPISKFGIIVSSRVSKKAVVRNKLKRQIREILREFLIQIRGGYNIIIIAQSRALDLDFDSLRYQLVFLFKKSHLL